MVLEMEDRWPYSSCFARCFFQDLFNRARSILVQFPSRFLSQRTCETIQIRRTRHAGNNRRSKDELISDVLLSVPSHRRVKLDDQLELIYNSSALIHDVVLKTSLKQWRIETNGER